MADKSFPFQYVDENDIYGDVQFRNFLKSLFKNGRVDIRLTSTTSGTAPTKIDGPNLQCSKNGNNVTITKGACIVDGVYYESNTSQTIPIKTDKYNYYIVARVHAEYKTVVFEQVSNVRETDLILAVINPNGTIINSDLYLEIRGQLLERYLDFIGKYTYVVYDNKSFNDWKNNLPGNDYTSVFVNPGTYGEGHILDLSETGTISITGSGSYCTHINSILSAYDIPNASISKLTINKCFGIDTLIDCDVRDISSTTGLVENCKISDSILNSRNIKHCNISDFAIDCQNIYNCQFKQVDDACKVDNCSNVVNCEFDSNPPYNYIITDSKNMINNMLYSNVSMHWCENIINCEGYGIVRSGIFYDSENLIMCVAEINVSGSGSSSGALYYGNRAVRFCRGDYHKASYGIYSKCYAGKGSSAEFPKGSSETIANTSNYGMNVGSVV